MRASDIILVVKKVVVTGCETGQGVVAVLGGFLPAHLLQLKTVVLTVLRTTTIVMSYAFAASFGVTSWTVTPPSGLKQKEIN